MLKRTSLLFVAALALSGGTPASAVSDAGFVPPEEAPVVRNGDTPLMQPQLATGIIQQKDAVKEMIEVKDHAGNQMSFFIGTNTPIYDKGRQQIAFEKLKPGDIVAVQYVAQNSSVQEIQKLNQNLPTARPPY